MGITRKHTILFVDDEVKNCKFFEKIFKGRYKILQAYDGVEALELFKKNQDEIALVISDQRMPKMAGNELLAKINALRPEVVKILSTAYSDIDAAIDLVNHGGLYRYVTKPWEIAEFEIDIKHAIEHYELNREKAILSKQKFTKISHFLICSRFFALASMAMYKFNFNIIPALRNLIQLSLIGKETPLLPDSIRVMMTNPDIWKKILNNFKYTLSKLNPRESNISNWLETHTEYWPVPADANPFRKVLHEILTRHEDVVSETSVKTLNAMIALHEHGKKLQGVLIGSQIEMSVTNKKVTLVEDDIVEFLADEDLIIAELIRDNKLL